MVIYAVHAPKSTKRTIKVPKKQSILLVYRYWYKICHSILQQQVEFYMNLRTVADGKCSINFGFRGHEKQSYGMFLIVLRVLIFSINHWQFSIYVKSRSKICLNVVFCFCGLKGSHMNNMSESLSEATFTQQRCTKNDPCSHGSMKMTKNAVLCMPGQ